MSYPPVNQDNFQINLDWDTAFYPGFLYVQPPRPPLVSSYVDWKNVLDYGADPTGTFDSSTAVMLAISNLSLGTITPPVAGQGGVIYFPAGNYKIANTIQVSEIAPITFMGDGPSASILYSYVNGDCIRMFNNYVPSGGPTSILVWGGGICDLTIDGTNAPTTGIGNVTGIHLGDMKYAKICNVNVQNFSQSNGVAFWNDNTKFWTEDSYFELHVNTSTVGILIDTNGGQVTHDNNQYILGCGMVNAGVAVRFINGSNAYHSNFLIHGGIRSGTVAGGYFFEMLSTGGSTFATNCNLVIQGESDGGGANTPALVHIASGSQFNGGGMLSFLTGHGTPSVIAGQFQFNGQVSNDTGITTLTPTVPSVSTTVYENQTIPQLMTIQGGTVTAIKINGNTIGGATPVTSGTFYLPCGTTYSITFTAAPTTTFIPVMTNQ